SVPLARWIGERLLELQPYESSGDEELADGVAWPRAAWGGPAESARRADLSAWPVRLEDKHLDDFLQEDAPPLSERATQGFFDRASKSSLKFPEGLLDDVAAHLEQARDRALVA